VHNQNRGDVVVEEDARNTAPTVEHLEAQLVVLLVTLREITPEVGRAVLVGVDGPLAEGPELGGDNLQEVLEHVSVLRGLENQHFSTRGRGLWQSANVPSIRYYPKDDRRLPSSPSGSSSW